MGSAVAKLVKLISKLLSASRIKAGIAAAKKGLTAFKDWYNDLPWLIRLAMDGFSIAEIYKVFRDLL